MERIIDMLTNKSYNTLLKMYQYQISLPDGKTFVPTSQADLADIVGVNVMTMNKIFKQLIEQELVTPVEGKRGKYALTAKATIIVTKMEEIQKEIEK